MAVDAPLTRARFPRPGRPTADRPAVAAVRTRRSWLSTGAAVAVVVLGGLLAVYLVGAAQHTDSVLVAAGPVDRGATITAQDLTTLDVRPGQNVAAFTSGQANELIGKIAVAPLAKGSLLTPSAVAPTLPVPAGDALVGVAVKSSALPVDPLAAGDTVVITPVAAQSATLTSKAVQPADVTGTVVSTPTTDATSGLVHVDVFVPVASASDVAGRAAAGLVAVYLVPGK